MNVLDGCVKHSSLSLSLTLAERCQPYEYTIQLYTRSKYSVFVMSNAACSPDKIVYKLRPFPLFLITIAPTLFSLS